MKKQIAFKLLNDVAIDDSDENSFNFERELFPKCHDSDGEVSPKLRKFVANCFKFGQMIEIEQGLEEMIAPVRSNSME